jgi:hypothetical protein
VPARGAKMKPEMIHDNTSRFVAPT